MKKYLAIPAFLIIAFFAKAQVSYPDSLRNELNLVSTDSARCFLNRLLSEYYSEKQLDSVVYYGEHALALARENNKQLNIAGASIACAFSLTQDGKYGKALKYILEALDITENAASEKSGWLFYGMNAREYRLRLLAFAHHTYALLQGNIGNIDQELFHYKEEIRIAEQVDSGSTQGAYMNLGNTYSRLGKPDSALYYGFKSDSMARSSGELYYSGWNLCNIGNVYFKRKDYDRAKKYYYQAFELSREKGNEGSLWASSNRLFHLYSAEKNADSSLYFAKLTLNSKISDEVNYLTRAYENLFEAYALKGQPDSSNKYLGLAFTTRDSAYNKKIDNLSDFQQLTMNEQLRLRELEKEKIESQGRVRTYSLLAGLAIFLIIGLLLIRNNRQKRRSNKILENTLSNLKATQSQLIQSEKMASLGELTAGIAHEIQNPLNFVNNFSEVNRELIDEIMDEWSKGRGERDEVLEKELLLDIRANGEKINEHGKRADAIVKSMLQHSRTSSGEKELTDINALCDEYLRLAYHGMRARDKSFNALLKTDFDAGLPKIKVVPQDIGRVILNIINNGFHAMHGMENPVMTLSTKLLKNQLEIRIADNGPGIPDDIKDKIFQPFFTTKPTGQGTGLGLSLSYDLINGYGGQIIVQSQLNQGSNFIIQLPIQL